MIFRHWLAVLFCTTCLVGTAGAARDEPLREPMRFTLHSPCDDCEPYLLAEGRIEIDTPDRFSETLQSLQTQRMHPRIHFNSPGGNLQGGLQLGKLIREAGLDTHVGGPYPEFVRIGEPPHNLVQRGVCFSACAYAFLGGVSRSLGERGLYGLHQFSGVAGEIGDSGAQVLMALLARYLDDMGVERRFLDFAATTTPEKIKLVPLALARTLGVDNQDPPRTPWRLEAGADGLVVSVAQRVAGSDAVLALRVLREDRRLVGQVEYRFRQSPLPEPELAEEFTVRGSPELVFRPVAGKDAERLPAEMVVVGDGWRRTGDGVFTTSFTADPEWVALLSGPADIEFSALATSRVPAVVPRVRLSTQGFAHAVRALER